MKKSLLTLAMGIAQKHNPKHPEIGRFQHFSFVIQDNKILEWATNTKKEPPRHQGYHSRLIDADYPPKTHAEINAYRKAKGLMDSKKTFEMINIRLNRQGIARISKPCSCCWDMMFALGCSCFYYSSEIGFLRTF